MKVHLITEASAAGVGRHVIDLARGLLERDCEVHLVYSPVRMDGPFDAALRDLTDLRSTPLVMQRVPRPGDLAVFWRLRSFLRENGPWDVVHAHSSERARSCWG